jgi:hypothetical protein
MERFQGFTGRFRRSKKKLATAAPEREAAFTD